MINMHIMIKLLKNLSLTLTQKKKIIDKVKPFAFLIKKNIHLPEIRYPQRLRIKRVKNHQLG